MKKIAIGSDHGGFHLKTEIIAYLKEMGYVYHDFGCYNAEPSDYPDLALKVGQSVVSEEYPYGILICGTGIGMSIAANKIKGIRAALCHDTFSARMTREHNNSNILTMGGRVIGAGLAKEIVKIWLTAEFSGVKRHIIRLQKVNEITEHQ